MTNDLNRLFLYIYLIGTPTLMIATKISEKYSPSFLKLSNRLLFLFHYCDGGKKDLNSTRMIFPKENEKNE